LPIPEEGEEVTLEIVVVHVCAIGIRLILLPIGDVLKKVIRNSLQAWKPLLSKKEKEAPES